MTRNKKLLVLTLILASIIIFEAVYLFVINNKPLQVNISKKTIISNFSKDALTPKADLPAQIISKAGYEQMLEGMKKRYPLIESRVLRSAVITGEYVGVVLDIKTEKKVINKLGNVFEASTMLTLGGDYNTKLTFNWSDEEIKKLKVYQQNNNNEQQIAFTDLKKGDNLMIKISVDMLFDRNRNYRGGIILRTN